MMINALTRYALLAIVLLSPAAAAVQPTKLKLAFSTSDRSEMYQLVIGPLVEVLSKDRQQLIEIEVYYSGVLGGLPQRPELSYDGVAHIATMVFAQFQVRFPDDALLELPGLFDNASEAVLLYTEMVRDLRKFVSCWPQSRESRRKTRSIA